jgi:hypothetical protein
MANKFRVNTVILNSQNVTTDGNRLKVGSSGVLYSGENYGNFITNSNLNGLISTGSADLRYLQTGVSGEFLKNSNLNGLISSGDSDNKYSTITNLNLTGSNSLNRDITLSGLIETSGTNLQNQITSIKGGTGVFIQNSNLQGLISTGSADLRFLQTGVSGEFYKASNPLNFSSSGNVETTGTNIQTQITSIIGGTGNFYLKSNPNNFTHSGYVNLAVTGWHSKSITIENPIPGDSVTLFQTQNAIQVQKVRSVVRGAGLGSGLFSIRSDPDRTAAGTELLVNGFSVTGRGTGENFISFSNSTISGNNWIWFFVSATGQTLSGLHETLFYTNL